MKTRRLRAGVILLLAVAALGAAGAAVDSSGSGSGSSGLGEGASSSAGGGDESSIASDFNPIGPLFPGEIISFVLAALVIGCIVAAIVACVIALLRWDWTDLVAYLRSKAEKIAMFVLGFAALYLLFQLLGSSGGSGSAGPVDSEVEGVSETASGTGIELSAAVGVAIVVVVLVVLLLVARSSDDDDSAPTPVAPDPDDAVTRSGSATPGEADVGRPPADNEVYRAWLSLADAANANARRDTPGEVADRAVDAGVDEDAAREITSLFESVRYGGREPTGGIEQRAKRARAELSSER